MLTIVHMIIVSYAHCFYIYSLLLSMLTDFTYAFLIWKAHYFWTWSLFLFFLLSSPLLSSPICLPMMKLSNSRNFLEHELMILNLLGTRHHYHPTYCLFLYAHCLSICSLSLWCLYATSSWPNDEWHVSEAPTTTFWCFLGVFWPTLVSLFGKQQLLCPCRWWNCRLQ